MPPQVKVLCLFAYHIGILGSDTENLIAKIGTNFVELVEEIIVKDHFTLVRCKEEGSVEKVVNECKKLKNGSELLKCELFLDP